MKGAAKSTRRTPERHARPGREDRGEHDRSLPADDPVATYWGTHQGQALARADRRRGVTGARRQGRRLGEGDAALRQALATARRSGRPTSGPTSSCWSQAKRSGSSTSATAHPCPHDRTPRGPTGPTHGMTGVSTMSPRHIVSNVLTHHMVSEGELNPHALAAPAPQIGTSHSPTWQQHP